ncbi:MAG: BAX inhibitor (BI)-1/YccA family protein, partial [Gammaproteobacteria bacterium]
MNTLTSRTVTSTPASSIATSRVLRNTYALLALTLIFSSLTAAMSMALNLPHPGLVITLVGYFGLLFLTTRYRNSGVGLLMVFALTGFMGYTL